MTVLEDIREALKTIDSLKQTIICHPDLEQRVKDLVEAEGKTYWYTVVANPYCSPQQIFIFPTYCTRP